LDHLILQFSHNEGFQEAEMAASRIARSGKVGQLGASMSPINA
jgi:hypothetical protein